MLVEELERGRGKGERDSDAKLIRGVSKKTTKNNKIQLGLR